MNMKNVSITNGQVQVDWDKVTYAEVRNLLYTIGQKLWKESQEVLRDDLANLRHDVERSATLTALIRRQAQDLIQRFNALDIKPEPKKKDSDPEPDPTPTPPAPKDSDQAPAWFATYTTQFGATDKDGKPTKAAAKSEVDAIRTDVDNLNKHLGYKRNKDGKVSFADRANRFQFSFNSLVGGLIGLIAAIVALTSFVLIGSEFGVSLFWSLMIGMAALVFGGLIAAPRNKRDKRDN